MDVVPVGDAIVEPPDAASRAKIKTVITVLRRSRFLEIPLLSE